MLSCYWFVIAAPVAAYVLAWAANKNKPTRDKFAIAVFFLTYIGCVCLRDLSVGVDTINYVRYFRSGPVLGWDHGYYYGKSEPGFHLLCAIISLIGNERLFLIICGLLAVVPIAILYFKESESAPLCCSFFLISLLFEFLFSGVRQGVAVGIGVISFYFVKKKKLIPFLFTVGLATSFHSSAIVLVILYPLFYAKITQKWIPVVLLIIGAAYVFKDTIFNTILLPMFGGDYLSGYEYLTGASDQGALSALFLLFAIYSCIMLDSDKADTVTLGFRNILLLAALVHIFTALHPVVCRLNYYFIPFIPLALSRVNNRVRALFKPIEQIVSFVLPIYFVTYFLFAKGDSLHIAPYLTFFM